MLHEQTVSDRIAYLQDIDPEATEPADQTGVKLFVKAQCNIEVHVLVRQ
jgi:hypothetical protein